MTLRINGVPASTSHDSFHGYHTDGQVMHLSSNLSLGCAGAEAAVNKKGRGLPHWFIQECANRGEKGGVVREIQWLP